MPWGVRQSIAFLFRFRSAYAEMATGTLLQNWLKKELRIGFEEGEREEYENGRRRGVKTKQGFVGETEREEER